MIYFQVSIEETIPEECAVELAERLELAAAYLRRKEPITLEDMNGEKIKDSSRVIFGTISVYHDDIQRVEGG